MQTCIFYFVYNRSIDGGEDDNDNGSSSGNGGCGCWWMAMAFPSHLRIGDWGGGGKVRRIIPRLRFFHFFKKWRSAVG